MISITGCHQEINISLKAMIGYKGLKSDLTCLGFQYEVGQTVTIEGPIKLCEKGFHFCQYSVDVLLYYDDETDVYVKVKAEGHVIEDVNKCVTDRLTVLELLTCDQLRAATSFA